MKDNSKDKAINGFSDNRRALAGLRVEINAVRLNGKRFNPRVVRDTLSMVRARALADALLSGELNSLHRYAALVRFVREGGLN